MNILGIEIKTHNKREEGLVRITNSELDDYKRYIKDNTFEDYTMEVVIKWLKEINNRFTTMYFLDMVDREHSIVYDEIEREFGFSIRGK